MHFQFKILSKFITNKVEEQKSRRESRGWDLDHGLAQDLNQRLSRKPRRCISGGYNTQDPAPKLVESGHVSTCTHRRCNRHSRHNSMDNPRLCTCRRSKRGRRRRRRRRTRWGEICHDSNKEKTLKSEWLCSILAINFRSNVKSISLTLKNGSGWILFVIRIVIKKNYLLFVRY